MTVVARLRDVGLADGSVSHVELLLGDEPVPEDSVFAALVVLRDALGRYAVVFSPRRGEWGPPGGWREPGESVVDCVLREVREETGLRLAPHALTLLGHERFVPVSLEGRWPAGGGVLQLFSARLMGSAPELLAEQDDARDPQWVTLGEFARRSGQRFWWPLIEASDGAT
ncbi:NUDIX hydrolase [Pedococcus sp. 5OH_020]|uniref:NUDIX hydrolase n=1 Tax=Pedococcus sp. 5OH_020 TaxID=2989814 RepID=UPI0022E9E984|nr:NUDIX hydrolase [Pedococcus sp. 5OH_020]